MSQPRNRPTGEALPWLTDEPDGQRRAWPVREIAGWLVAAALLAAGAAYWFTLSSSEPPPPVERTLAPAASSTVTIPRAAPPQSDTAGTAGKLLGDAPAGGAGPAARKAVPVSRPAAPGTAKAAPARNQGSRVASTESGPSNSRAPTAAKPVKVAAATAGSAKAAAAPAKPAAAQAGADKVAATPSKPAAAQASAAPAKSAKTAKTAKSATASASPAKPLQPSAATAAKKLLAPPQPTFKQHAYPSVVNLAAFNNAKQGHAIWHEVVRTFPAARALTPAVIQNRDWNGRLFYQFQIGTASPSDSQVFCQSLKSLDLRCEVVNLP